MEGRAAPTLPETFFSLYYNAILKTHSRLGTIIGVSSLAAVFVSLCFPDLLTLFSSCPTLHISQEASGAAHIENGPQVTERTFTFSQCSEDLFYNDSFNR